MTLVEERIEKQISPVLVQNSLTFTLNDWKCHYCIQLPNFRRFPNVWKLPPNLHYLCYYLKHYIKRTNYQWGFDATAHPPETVLCCWMLVSVF